MPTFPTPDPITASVEIVSGSVHVVATDRDDTVVERQPAGSEPGIRCPDSRERARRLPERHPHGVGGQALHLPRPRRRRHRRHRTAVAFTPSGVVGVRATCAPTATSGIAGSPRPVGMPVVGSVAGNIKADSASGGITVESRDGRGGHLDGVGRCHDRRAHRRRQVPGGQRLAVGQAAARHGQRADRVRRHHRRRRGQRWGLGADRQWRHRSRCRGGHRRPARPEDAFGRTCATPCGRRTGPPTATKR